MFDLFDLGSPNRPEKGIIELRVAYVLEDNSLYVYDKYGTGILSLKLDKFENNELATGFTKIMKPYAIKKKEEAEEQEKKREEWQRKNEEKAVATKEK